MSSKKQRREEPSSSEEEEEEEDYEEEEAEMRDMDKTPVTIVTGFLGAGKSTLINYILREQHGMKIAVIENEFGSVSIDDELVSANVQSKEDLVVLDNGCVCCTVRGDLMNALFKLAAGNFDSIVIETTGLADPAPVAFTFNDATISCNYRIDSILCVADAKNLASHLRQSKSDGTTNEAVQQIAFADRILLNKTDLVSQEEKLAVLEEIKEINAFAEIIECQQSCVELDRILNVSSFSIETSKEVDRAVAAEKEEHHSHSHSHGTCGGAATCSHGHSHSNKKKPHTHLSGVSSQGIILEGTISMKRFGPFLDKLLEDCGKENLYRCKGMVSFSSKNRIKSVFHGVHEQISFGAADVAWPTDGKPRQNKMVFIGKNLPPNIEQRVRECLYAEGEQEEDIEDEEEE